MTNKENNLLRHEVNVNLSYIQWDVQAERFTRAR